METKRAQSIQDSLEKKINKEYQRAYKDMLKKLKKLSKDFQKQDKINKKTMSDEDYKAWRQKVARRAKWISDMIKSYSDRLTDADLKAVENIKQALPEVYAEGRDYGTWQVERAGHIDTNYALTDPDAVRAGVIGDYMQPNPDIPKDERWNKQKVTNAITQGILQGEDMNAVAKRLRQVTDMDRSASIRNARTWTGCAQEQGKDDAYRRARDMGCDIENIWISTIDMKTRHSHRRLDTERKEIDAKFSNGLRFPCDMQGKPAEVYNCRCRMGCVVKGIPFDMSDRVMDIGSMTYEEWHKGKKQQAKQAQPKGINANGKIGVANIKQLASIDGILARAVQKLTAKIDETEIIRKIGGRDMTGGSCVSLAMAYAGNKCGFDATDYRGGKSQYMFSGIMRHIKSRLILKDAVIDTESDFNNMKGTTALLGRHEDGKEYLLFTGEHCSVVKFEDGHWRYLELQGRPDQNGWHSLTTELLKKRFKVHRSHTIMGMKLQDTALVIDLQSLKKCGDFETVLSYLNTEPSKQKKGNGGGLR